MEALGMYSDSDTDNQDESINEHSKDQNEKEVINAAKSLAPSPPSCDVNCEEETYIMPTEPPIIPSSPDSKPDSDQTEKVAALLKTYSDHETYVKSTFHNLDFLENPRFTANKLKEIGIFQVDDESDHSKLNLDQYSSELSLKIFDPNDHLRTEDSADTLVKKLEEKIRENERKMQERKQRREHEQMMKQQNAFLNQPKVSMESILLMNAAKQKILEKRGAMIASHRRNKKSSRWDDK